MKYMRRANSSGMYFGDFSSARRERAGVGWKSAFQIYIHLAFFFIHMSPSRFNGGKNPNIFKHAFIFLEEDLVIK